MRVAAAVTAAALAFAVGVPAVGPSTIPTAHAVELALSESDNALEQVFSDVALIPRTDGIVDRLLAVLRPRVGDPTVTVLVLGAERGRWTERTAVEVPIEVGMAIEAGVQGDPWLVATRAEAWVLIVPSAGGSLIAPLERVSDEIRLGTAWTVPFEVTAAGLADANGDGREELVITGRESRRRLGACDGTRVVVEDPETLRFRSEWLLPEVGPEATVLGEFDGLPGAELAMLTTCASSPGGEPGRRVLAIAVADGRVTRDIPLPDPMPAWQSAFPPAAADLDGDGIDELILSRVGGLTVVGPAGLAPEPILPDTRILAGLRGAGVRPALVAGLALDRTANMPAAVLRVLDGPGSTPVVSLLDRPISMSTLGGPGPDTWIDLDGDGCPELMAMSAILDCANGWWRPGPSFHGVQPLAIVGEAAFRRLLVAQSVSWEPGTQPGFLGAVGPRPLAATGLPSGGAASTWRRGPSAPFVLSELDVTDLLYFQRYPRPDPTMERRTRGVEGVVEAAGWTGSMYYVHVTALGEDDRGPTDLWVRGLDDDPGAAATLLIERIAVPAGRPAAGDTSVARIPVGQVRADGAAAAQRWVVDLVAVNAWGEVSEPIRDIVIRDLVGPPLTVDPPFLSVPWPFSTRIEGVAEPGATVYVGDGPPLTTTSRGRFDTRITLAPWPQDVTFRAVDEAGNETVRIISMIGGLDWRQLPWQVILALVILAAVAAGTIAEGRRVQARLLAADLSWRSVRTAYGRQRQRAGMRRDVAWGGEERDDVPLPEIEEIPPGPTSHPRGSAPKGRC